MKRETKPNREIYRKVILNAANLKRIPSDRQTIESIDDWKNAYSFMGVDVDRISRREGVDSLPFISAFDVMLIVDDR